MRQRTAARPTLQVPSSIPPASAASIPASRSYSAESPLAAHTPATEEEAGLLHNSHLAQHCRPPPAGPDIALPAGFDPQHPVDPVRVVAAPAGKPGRSPEPYSRSPDPEDHLLPASLHSFCNPPSPAKALAQPMSPLPIQSFALLHLDRLSLCKMRTILAGESDSPIQTASGLDYTSRR
jgi:hypothetical protein